MSQDAAQNNFYDFLYGKFLLKEYFDIVLHEHDYIEHGYNIWREIGNLTTCVHSFEFEIPEDGIVPLPCNVQLIHSVARGYPTVQFYENNGHIFRMYNSWKMNPHQFLSDALMRAPSTSPDILKTNRYKAVGEYIPYVLQGQPGSYSLHFLKEHMLEKAVIIYSGILLDDDGNPVLNRKEAEAIAYKLAFIDTQKRAFKHDVKASNLLAYIKPEAERKMAAAKIPEYINDNEWDRVFSAKTSHDRKVYWSSYKGY
jgi:hypothetical protein